MAIFNGFGNSCINMHVQTDCYTHVWNACTADLKNIVTEGADVRTMRILLVFGLHLSWSDFICDVRIVCTNTTTSGIPLVILFSSGAKQGTERACSTCPM